MRKRHQDKQRKIGVRSSTWRKIEHIASANRRTIAETVDILADEHLDKHTDQSTRAPTSSAEKAA